MFFSTSDVLRFASFHFQQFGIDHFLQFEKNLFCGSFSLFVLFFTISKFLSSVVRKLLFPATLTGTREVHCVGYLTYT